MNALMANIPDWFMPTLILLVSILALTVIFERGWLLLRRIQFLDIDDERQLINYIREKKYEEAESFCRMQNHPAYKVILAVLESRGSKINLKSIAEEENLRQTAFLEKYLPTLGTISTIAPLLGLLGTVTGMIKSFRAFEQNVGRSEQLMGGIDEALITTALGLIVAIPALIMYNYYVRRVGTFTEETNVLTDMVIEEFPKKK